METEEKLNPLRQKIEAVDGQILRLLNERAEIVLEVDRVKSEIRMESYDPQREEEILRRLILQNSGPFPRESISPVFTEIISACRSLEVELTVAYLGPPGTHTHLACLEHFGSSIQSVPQESIQDVFETVEKAKASYGIVPIENSTEGVVNRTLDVLIESEVKICGEVLIRISHDLLSLSGRVKDIEKIYSHPQALEQCRKWLRKTFPYIPLIETVSTSKAAQFAADDPKAAAIANSSAARIYGLKVIESQIEDYLNNYTRFLILSREINKRTGRDKTSLLLSIPHTPGSLYEVLRPFSEKRINLTKIESRPVKGRPWEYVFFLDFEGHVTDSHIIETISELKENVLFLKVLGSYPRCPERGRLPQKR
jgi:chorismate mutase/prephenate dehydratase